MNLLVRRCHHAQSPQDVKQFRTIRDGSPTQFHALLRPFHEITAALLSYLRLLGSHLVPLKAIDNAGNQTRRVRPEHVFNYRKYRRG